MPDESDIAAILQDYVPRAEYEAALDAVNDAVEARDALQKQYDDGAGRLKDLEGKVRGRAWRDSYETARRAAGVPDHYADDVYELLKLSQDTDGPDERAVEKALGAFLEKRPHYASGATDQQAQQPQRTPPGGAPGHRASTTGAPGLTREQLADPKFMLSPRNREFIKQATSGR